jgi:ATP-dependent exoDNAse (exonuclease V) alpha subunit
MPTKAIPWVEQRTKLALADSQREAVRVALVSKVLVITGGPGVGKTTLVNSILKILLAKTIAIALCAPTGRAAKRLSERGSLLPLGDNIRGTRSRTRVGAHRLRSPKRQLPEVTG